MTKVVGMSKDAIEKKGTKGPSLWQYKPPSKLMDDAALAVDFLHWASKQFPKRPVPTSHIVRIAMNRATLPKEDSDMVEGFRKKRMQRIKALAIKEYNRPIIPIPGMGWRMATTDEDVLVSHVERVNRRLISTVRSHERALGMVDEKKLKGRHKERYEDLSKASKQMTGGVMKKLLPPETED